MRRLLPALLLLLAVVAVPKASAEQPVLDRPQHGPEAVQALGEQLAAVAREHDTTPAELRERFLQDMSLWVDEQGRLFYVDPAPDRVEEATVAAGAEARPADVFGLHSKATVASRVIYLDFTGHGAGWGGTIGGGWDSGYTGGDGAAEPYSLDGDLSFNEAELTDIWSIWQRVAEDFAPFDVDVTTEEPAAGAIDRDSSGDQTYGTRVVITSSSTTCGCGGVAYVGVFDHTTNHSYYQPAFVYNEGAKAAAEAASHEAGHNLGLSHDGTRSVGYYDGHAGWAPIMGVGYYEPLSQWSKGEYSGANNKEDDLVIAQANGASLRSDDHGTGAGARSLAGEDGADGVIERATDVDEFAFSVAEPTTLAITVRPAVTSPNLDLRAVLRSADGTVLATDSPAMVRTTEDVAAGLGATVQVTVPQGTYVLAVDGVGLGDPSSTGYSDYGSLGAYSVSVTGGTLGVPGTTPTSQPPPVPDGVTAVPVSGGIGVTWNASTGATDYEVQRMKQLKGGAWPTGWTAVAVTTLTSWTDVTGAGTYRYQVRARSAAGTPSGWSATAEASVTKTSGRR